MQLKCEFKPAALQNNGYWSQRGPEKIHYSIRNISKEIVSYKTKKGPNLSVEGLRRGSGKACQRLGVQRVICSATDLPLWIAAEPPTEPGAVKGGRWEAIENVEKATKRWEKYCGVPKIKQQHRIKQNVPVNFHLFMSEKYTTETISYSFVWSRGKTLGPKSTCVIVFPLNFYVLFMEANFPFQE